VVRKGKPRSMRKWLKANSYEQFNAKSVDKRNLSTLMYDDFMILYLKA